MSNPIFIDCPAEKWKKVATGVTTGTIHKWDKSPYGYLHTYRETGGSAPTLKEEGIPAFVGSNTLTIAHTSLIDVYLYSLTDPGRVRVDL
jgi:hypothetical protein